MIKIPKDSFWSVTTIPFRIIFIIILSIFFLPLGIFRKIWAPQIPFHFMGINIYLFMRYGNYEETEKDWND